MENFEYPPTRISETPKIVTVLMGCEIGHEMFAKGLLYNNPLSHDFITCRIDSPIIRRKNTDIKEGLIPSYYKPGYMYNMMRKIPSQFVIFLDNNHKDTMKKVNEKFKEMRSFNKGKNRTLPKKFMVLIASNFKLSKKHKDSENIDPNNQSLDFLKELKKNYKLNDEFMIFDECNPHKSFQELQKKINENGRSYYREKSKYKESKLEELLKIREDDKNYIKTLRKTIRLCFKIGFINEFIKETKKSLKAYMQGYDLLCLRYKSKILGNIGQQLEFIDALGYFNYKITNLMLIDSDPISSCNFFLKTISFMKKIGKNYQSRDLVDFKRKLSKQYAQLGKNQVKYKLNYSTKNIQLEDQNFCLYHSHNYFLIAAFYQITARKYSKMITHVDGAEILDVLGEGYHSIPKMLRNIKRLDRTIVYYGLLMANEFFLAGEESKALAYYVKIVKSEHYFIEQWPQLLLRILDNGIKIASRNKKHKDLMILCFKSLHPLNDFPKETRIHYQNMFFNSINETDKDFCVSSELYSNGVLECVKVIFNKNSAIVNEEIFCKAVIKSHFPLPLHVHSIDLTFSEIQEKATAVTSNIISSDVNEIVLSVTCNSDVKRLTCSYITINLCMDEKSECFFNFRHLFNCENQPFVNLFKSGDDLNISFNDTKDLDLTDVKMDESQVYEKRFYMDFIKNMDPKSIENEKKDISLNESFLSPTKSKNDSFLILSPIFPSTPSRTVNIDNFLSRDSIIFKDTETDEDQKVEAKNSGTLLFNLFNSMKQHNPTKEAVVKNGALHYDPMIIFSSFLDLCEKFEDLTCVVLYDSHLGTNDLCKFFNSLSRRTNSCLKKIVLSKNKMDDTAFTSLAQFFKSEAAKNLRSLHLWSTFVSDSSVDIIKDSIKNLKQLKTFNVGFNRVLGDKGILNLLSVLKDLALLSKLGLAYTYIGLPTLEGLNEKFSFHSSLIKIDLSYNEIDVSSSKHLQDFIISKTHLESLFLDGNKIFELKIQGKEKKLNENGSKFLKELENYIHNTNYSLCSLHEQPKSPPDEFKTLLPDEFKNLIERNSLFKKILRDIKSGNTTFRWDNKFMDIFPHSLILNVFANDDINITKLDLTNNRIESIHSSFFTSKFCSTLTFINLSGNRFRFFPDGISRLPSLTHLDLSHNYLERIPYEISQISKLRILLLNNNKISEFPSKHLAHLDVQTIDLSFNEIEELPSDIKFHSCLESLNLMMNKLSTLPNEILKLNSLKFFNISQNKFEIVAPSICRYWQMTNCKVDFKKNPMTFVPEEIVQQGNEQVLDYLASYHLKEIPCNLVKLVMTGSKKSGKTSLVKCLVQGGNPKNMDFVEFREWIISNIGNNAIPEMNVNVLDFPSNVPENSQQFFYSSSKTVHMLVFKMSKPLEENNNKILSFLENIKLRAPKSHVCLVGTHYDTSKENVKLINEFIKNLFMSWENASENKINKVTYKVDKEEFYFFPVSTTTNDGINTLKSKVCEVFEKIISKSGEMSSTVLKLIEILKKKSPNFYRNPVLSWEEFTKWGLFTEESEWIKASKILHDVGVLYSFKGSAIASSVRLSKETLPPVSPKLDVRLSIGNGESEFDKFVILDPNYLVKMFSSLQLLKHQSKGSSTSNIFEELDTIPYLKKEVASQYLKDNFSKINQFCFHFHYKFDLWHSLDEERIINLSKLKSADKSLTQNSWKPTVGLFFFAKLHSFPFLPVSLFNSLVLRSWKFFGGLKCFFSDYCQLKNDDGIMTIRITKGNTEKNPFSRKIEFYTESPTEPKAAHLMSKLNLVFNALLRDWYSCGSNFLRQFQSFTQCPNCITTNPLNINYFNTSGIIEQLKEGGDLLCEFCGSAVRLDRLLPELWDTLLDSNYSSSIVEGGVIGSGGFGKIYKGELNGKKVAIKKLIIEEDNNTTQILADFCNETFLTKMLSEHDNIISFHKAFSNPLALVIEYAPHGSLLDVVKTWEGKQNWPLVIRISRQIASALNFMHNCNPPVLHRDIKACNVLVFSQRLDAEINVKLADLGASCLNIGLSSAQMIDNPAYLSPESLLHRFYTKESDVYAYGVLLCEILYRDYPFEIFNIQTELERRIIGGLKPFMIEDCLPEFRSLIRKCLSSLPSSRPTFEEILGLLKKVDKKNSF